jgi:hypothetical protein
MFSWILCPSFYGSFILLYLDEASESCKHFQEAPRKSPGSPLKLGCLNRQALCTYFVGTYGRSLKQKKCFRRWTKPKLLRVLLRLRITRAPPWCFLPIIQSCFPPRLWPPINNPPAVKLPLSIQWTPTAQCCLPGGISSLLAPSPLPCHLLGYPSE